MTIKFFSVFLFFSFVIAVLLIRNPHVVNSQQITRDASSTDEVIVRYKTSTGEPEKERMRKNLRTFLKQKIQRLNIDVVRIQEGTVEEKIRQYKKDPNVVYAEPNFKAQAFGFTNDTSLSKQWGLFRIDAADYASASAWDVTISSSSVKLAVLDTGIEESHPDLAGKVTARFNFTDSPTLSDIFGHGTHVAGIAAAATNNGSGVAGAGYNTSLINGKVLGDDGSGYYSWVASGIMWAADQGAQVINMSLGGGSPSQTLQDAVDYAWSKGSVVVAAAGNSGNSSPQYPGYYQNVIAVGATDNNDIKASFSTYGNWVDVAAPGVGIYSTYKGGSYGSLSGTSMATPFAAGTSALVWAKGTCKTNICVRDQLEKTADKISGTGTYWTWGRINAYKAVSDIVPTSIPTPTNIITPTPTLIPLDTIKPTVLITYPISGSTVARRTNITVTANADDNMGVSKVVFYRNGSQICTTGPTAEKKYSCSMYTGSVGNKITYKVTASDAAGNSASSSVVVRVR